MAIIFNGYLRIVLHKALLSTAKDITLHEGISTNRYLCLSGQGQRLNKFKVSRFRGKSNHNVIFCHVLCCRINPRCGTLTGTKDMASIIGTAHFGHSHVVGTDFCIVFDINSTFTTTPRCIRISHGRTRRYCRFICLCGTVVNPVSSDCGLFATAIDTASNLCNTLNGDCTVATNQTRIAMCLNTLSGTEYATSDNRSKFGIIICSTFHWCLTDGNYRVLFYTANLTTAIDVTSTFHEVSCFKSTHSTISNSDTRATFA